MCIRDSSTTYPNRLRFLRAGRSRGSPVPLGTRRLGFSRQSPQAAARCYRPYSWRQRNGRPYARLPWSSGLSQMLLKFKKWALVLTIADVQLNPLPPTLYNVPYPLLFPASRKPGAGPLGTRTGLCLPLIKAARWRNLANNSRCLAKFLLQQSRAVPLGTRKLEFARQQAGTALTPGGRPK